MVFISVAQETFVASLGPFFLFFVDLGNNNINIVQKKRKKKKHTWDSRREAPRVPSPVVTAVVLPLLFLLALMKVVWMVVVVNK